MKRAGFIMALFAMIVLSAQTIDLSPDKTALTVVSDQPGMLDLHLEIDAISTGEVTIGGTSYNTLSVADWGGLTQIGYPALPQFGKRIAIPGQSDIKISISNIKRQIIQGFTPYPAQPPAVDEVGAKTPAFTVDSRFYKSGATYPEQSVWEENRGDIRGVEMALIRFAPVSWDPATRELTVIESCDITIQYSTGNIYDERLHSRWFDSLYQSRVLNRAQLTPAPIITRNRDTGCDFLIITSTEMQEAAEQLRDWKQMMGYISQIAYVEDIGEDSDDIHDYLEEAYDTWDFLPSFVAILGDADIVACDYVWSAIENNTVGTDLTMFCMGGYYDYYPDFAAGRISVNDASQALTTVSKMIQYEANPPTQASFYQNATVCAYFQDNNDDYNNMDGYEDRRFVKTSEEIRDGLMDEGYTVERIYYTPYDRTPTHYNNGSYANGEAIPSELLRANGFAWDGNETDITNAIESGTFLVNHRDHGISRNYTYDSGADPSFDGWGDPYYDSWDAAALTNGDLLPFVFSINCQTGWFDGETDSDDSKNYESFCEEFIRNENGGAVGAYGASRSSLSGYNDFFVRGYIDSMWEDFMPDFFVMDSGGSTSLMMITGLLAMEEFWGQGMYSEYEFQIFHNFCDPTLRIWRQQPQAITVEHPVSLDLVTTSVPVTVSEIGGVATLVYDGQIRGRAEITQTNFSIALDEPIELPGTATIVVNTRDCLVYTGEIEFIPPATGYVVIDSLVVSDPNGNNDGEWDVGEELNLQFFYRNAGTETCDAVTANLSSDQMIDLDDDSTGIESLDAGEMGSFEITGTLTTLYEDDHEAGVTVSIENTTGTFEEQFIILAVYRAKLVCAIDSVNTQIDAPEQMQIPVTVQNVGPAPLEISVTNFSNQAADLTGVGSYITAPSSAEFENLEEMTMMMWFYIPAGYSPGYLIYKGESFQNRTFQVAIPSLSLLNYGVMNIDGTNFSMNVDHDFEEDRWYHFAITVSQEAIRSYLDGALLAEEDFMPPVRYNEEAFFFGSAMNGTFEFDGYLDCVAFYSRELSDVEIMEKSCHLIPWQETGLIGYFPLDEEYGATNVVTGVEGTEIGDVVYDQAGAPIPTWFYTDNTTLEIDGYSQMDINLIFTPEDYQGGLYDSYIRLNSNSSYGESIDIPVTMNYTYYSVNDQPQPEEAFAVSLLSNPFTPGVRPGGFRFDLPEPTNVEITLYNIKGQRVRKLVSEKLTQGNHRIVWDGRDQTGKTARSGIYFARITAGKHTTTRKMLLIR